MFSKTRFQDIYSNICFRNMNQEPSPGNEKMYKINPLVDCILENSQKYYVPGKHISIDEAMIAFRGRHSLIQFMPLKPIRYGFKAFLLCEARSGYVLQWKLPYFREKMVVALNGEYKLLLFQFSVLGKSVFGFR